jgi:Uncharacterized protein conserved in bacteria
MFENMSVFAIIGIIALVIFLLIIITTGYLKAPPDKAFIISGFKKKEQIIIGRAKVKIPFLERKDELDLSLIQVDIQTERPVPTKEFINISVDGVANVQIASDEESLHRAARNFLNRDVDYIASIAQQVLEGNMREIIGQMELVELVHNRDEFAKKVEDSTARELSNMGLMIINLNIQNFEDENNVLIDLGIDNVATIQKNAAIAKAKAQRDVEVEKSKAASEANKAEVDAKTEISIRENELLIKQADLKALADKQQAIADAAYEIAKEQSRKEIEIEHQNAEIAKTEKMAERAKKEIEVSENELIATIRNKADAALYEQNQKTEAEKIRVQKEAEARAYEVEREAEAELKRADAIRQVGLAEAEVLEKKAEAQNRLNNAALAQELIQVLPEIVRSAAEPLAQTEKIVMFGEGNAERMMQDTINSSFSVFEGVEQATGLDLKAILNNFAGTKMALDSSDAGEVVTTTEDAVEYEEATEE